MAIRTQALGRPRDRDKHCALRWRKPRRFLAEIVYRVPAPDALDASTLAVRLERWRIGAEHAGWKFGWRDAPIAGDPGRRYVETYCYAFAAGDFLENEQQQLYWRTDIVQMTRYYMIEAARSGIHLSPRHAGFPV